MPSKRLKQKHQRKQKSVTSYNRKSLLRRSYDVVLIVCEGEKTEKNYLLDFRDDLKLHPNIKVIGLGEDPLRIVERAVLEYKKTRDYDRIYCVFDKDEHAGYGHALTKIFNLRKRASCPLPIYAITSVPCFEYWLLLHFVYSTNPYYKSGSKSASDRLKSEIRKHIDGYSEASKDIFKKIKPHFETAIDRAKKVSIEQTENSTDNPSTDFHKLAEYLLGIKS